MSSLVSTEGNEDIASSLIKSILTMSSGESLCASTSEIPQLIQNFSLAKSPQLSYHHILELDLSNNHIRKIHGLEVLSSLRRYELPFSAETF
jgi:hypothetical protein